MQVLSIRGRSPIVAVVHANVSCLAQTFPVWHKRHPDQTTYSWDNGLGLFSSRIDVIWAPLMLERSISACGCFPSFLSDHRYMLLRFSLTEAFERGPGAWKFNASLLNNADYCQLVTSFWQFWKTLEGSDWCGSDTGWWDSGKFYLRVITQWFGSRLKPTDGKRKRDLSRRLNELQRQFDDGDPSVFSTLCEVQEELRSFYLADARASQVRARCRWAEEGEASSKFFLSLEKKHKASQSVYSIRDPGTGHVHHDPFSILSTWQSYYSNLFSAETCDLVEQATLLSTVTRKLTPAVAPSCEGLLTPAECHSALLGMSRGKIPGSDGFPMEFYVRFWDVLGDDLVRVLNSAYDADELSTSQRRGLIIVLYKKSDKLETKNYRPISLLNMDYKIATRVLAGRLLSVISLIVGPHQTCGIPGRTISENLMFIRDLVEYAHRVDLPLALLSLDQEKAFDRVDWSFLQRILRHFGFGDSFCR